MTIPCGQHSLAASRANTAWPVTGDQTCRAFETEGGVW
jgi:hypothetical protein